LDNLQKVSDQIASRNPRTKDGIRIQQEQLERFSVIKRQLEENADHIQQRTPYINVKQVVPKLY
jgi:hypothetical protein